MKNLLYLLKLLVLFILIISCDSNNNEIELVNEIESVNEIENNNGLYSRSSYNDSSSKLTYRGNNLWSGNIGSGKHGYFRGPSQNQLDNGIRSSWEMTTPLNNSTWYNSAYTSWGGDGSYFYAVWNSGSLTTEPIRLLPTVKKQITNNSNGTQDIVWVLGSSWEHGITSFGTPRVSTFKGKIVLNENCEPIIVSKSSKRPTGCMADDGSNSGGGVPY
ncbi:hypothetical protein [Polaribacter sp. 20A6]|uniref:hypothetical protein n=1 Tax=Polaribacter sp. 20A6 TaxID=2687289 RepID=UPI0013FD7488|nr:hypothetical protein [Polaribacter sp. 20A6]